MTLTTSKLLEIMNRFLNVQTTDEELIALRKLFDEMDEKTAIKLASTSMDPKILCDLMPSIGCSWPKAYEIAEKRLKDLFPEEYKKYQRERDDTRDTLRSMIGH